jgi:hypothetical protein
MRGGAWKRGALAGSSTKSLLYPIYGGRVIGNFVSASPARSVLATAAALLACSAGCDPILNIQGSFFPAWMLCIVLGIALTVAARYLFVLLRLEPHLGPLTLIYPSLALLLAVLTWLALYRS